MEEQRADLRQRGVDGDVPGALGGPDGIDGPELATRLGPVSSRERALEVEQIIPFDRHGVQCGPGQRHGTREHGRGGPRAIRRRNVGVDDVPRASGRGLETVSAARRIRRTPAAACSPP